MTLTELQTTVSQLQNLDSLLALSDHMHVFTKC